MPNKMNEQAWTASFNVDEKIYEPMRSIRRFTRADNCYNDRDECQTACDIKNTRKEKYEPLKFIDPVTPKNKIE